MVIEGVTRWITAKANPRILTDGSVVWEGVLTDITERKLAEQSLARAKAHAEKLERLKTDFLTQMSHEIRTSGKLLTGIVNYILDLSKIEADQLITEERPFNLQSVVETVETLRTSITNPAVSLIVEPPNNSFPLLIGDQRRIEQVLANLLSNAIKFTDQGSIKVTFDCRQVTPFTAALKVTVQDTGIGIASSFIPQLFTPFRQSDTGVTRQYGGTGLGLSISKQLTELMGGHIHVLSEPGTGSTFWFELALSADGRKRLQTPDAPNTTQATRQRLVDLRILVVDDSLAIRELLQQLLTHEGAQVELSADGAQALAVLQQADKPFDCVMMDIQMPVMDGLTATQNIRAILRFEQLPVFAMTAGLLAEQQTRARQAGMTDVIPKPIEIDDMMNQILVAVGRNHATFESNSGNRPNVMPLIAGIDRDYVHRALDGDIKLFDKLVLIFVEEFEGLEDRICERLVPEAHPTSLKEAIRFSHSLHGAARVKSVPSSSARLQPHSSTHWKARRILTWPNSTPWENCSLI